MSRRRSTYGAHVSDHDEKPPVLVEPRVAAAVVDLFVYVVVLTLFVEYFPRVIKRDVHALRPDRCSAQGRPRGHCGGEELGEGAVPPSLYLARETGRRPLYCCGWC